MFTWQPAASLLKKKKKLFLPKKFRCSGKNGNEGVNLGRPKRVETQMEKKILKKHHKTTQRSLNTALRAVQLSSRGNGRSPSWVPEVQMVLMLCLGPKLALLEAELGNILRGVGDKRGEGGFLPWLRTGFVFRPHPPGLTESPPGTPQNQAQGISPKKFRTLRRNPHPGLCPGPSPRLPGRGLAPDPPWR